MPLVSRLQIELKPSPRLAGVLGGVHVLALAAVWLSLEGWPRYLVACGLLLSAVGCLSEILHRTSRAAVSLELLDDGRASWRDRGATWHEGRLGEDHFVSSALVVMRLDQTQGGRKWLVLAADSGAPEDLRRLRVWLRWHREAGAGGSGAGARPE
jgi:hypothetical protein